jgi:hypothetical protein
MNKFLTESLKYAIFVIIMGVSWYFKITPWFVIGALFVAFFVYYYEKNE